MQLLYISGKWNVHLGLNFISMVFADLYKHAAPIQSSDKRCTISGNKMHTGILNTCMKIKKLLTLLKGEHVYRHVKYYPCIN